MPKLDKPPDSFQSARKELAKNTPMNNLNISKMDSCELSEDISNELSEKYELKRSLFEKCPTKSPQLQAGVML